MKDICKLELIHVDYNLQIYNKAQIIDTTVIQNGNTGGGCITKMVNRMSRFKWIWKN